MNEKENFQVKFLNDVMELDELASRVLKGIDLVLQGGEEGISQIPPELLLESYTSLSVVITAQRTAIKKMAEHSMQIVDELEKRFPEV